MKTKTFGVTVASLAVVLLGAAYSSNVAFAEGENTYMYVNTSGNVMTEVATNPAEALREAENIAPHSGVILIDNNPSVAAVAVDNQDEMYGYVDINGNLQTEVAETPREAINEAERIAPHSGVILIKATSTI